MPQLTLVKDVLPALITPLKRECSAALRQDVAVSSILAKEPMSGPTIHIYVAGGYPRSLMSHTSVVMAHCYAQDGPTAQRLAALAAAVIGYDRQEWHSGRVQSGPYDNPHPDYPDARRYSMQAEVTAELERVDVD